MKKNYKFLLVFFLIFFTSEVKSETFDLWLQSFKNYAIKNGISEKTFNETMSKVNFNPKVIEYDRFQPEFYEDTKTYIDKRASDKKVKNAIKIYKQNQFLIDEIEKKFSVEKELLLALMGIETNFGKYLGKMNILSSLATLSYDKRRRDFFTNELMTILQLIENDIIDHNILYGSWAGAFGNFQFMPTTIKKYAIDYDGNSLIELRSTKDSFASAANYISKIGWKTEEPCFYKIKLKENVPINLLNSSAKKIKNKKKVSLLKQYIENFEELKIESDFKAALVTPDKDIIEDSNDFSPAYIVFNNYEVILKWNRSLRFALAVCTLKDKLKNKLYD